MAKPFWPVTDQNGNKFLIKEVRLMHKVKKVTAYILINYWIVFFVSIIVLVKTTAI